MRNTLVSPDALRTFAHPEGNRLPALERNILKFRAMEMMLFLFYAEDLKRFIVSCFRATKGPRKLTKTNQTDEQQGLAKGKEKHLETALNFFVSDGALTQSEKGEIVKLIDYRNHIAHQIEYLTADIGRNGINQEYRKYRGKKDPRYDYDALTRLRNYQTLFEKRAQSRYVMEISFSPLYFEAAEKTLQEELKRLRRKIDRQYSHRREENSKLQRELSLQDTDFAGDLHPYHPANKTQHERLTKRGIEICYRLYDLGKSPIAVAFLMHMSLSAAKHRYALWRSLGGFSRPKVEIPEIAR